MESTIKMKKDLQGIAKTIREDIEKKNGYKVYFPKAMMTAQQINKRTATMKIGEGRYDEEENKIRKERANGILTNQQFIDFCKTYNAKAFVEVVNAGEDYKRIQIRINY